MIMVCFSIEISSNFEEKHIMAAIIFLLSFILGLLFIVGIISPKKILKRSVNPTRGKIFLFFGLPSLALFIGWGAMYESSWDEALKDPVNAKEVSLKYKKLDVLPDELEQMTNLISLDLAKNNLRSLPIYLKDFDQLESIDLAENPIEELPLWLADMEALKSLNLNGTQITSIPDLLSNLSINYRNTPLWLAENPEKVESQTKTETSSYEEDHSESLTEFALRKLLEDDNDYRRKFKKGEIFYNDPVTNEQVDQIGEFMIAMGLFDDEKEASMLLDYNDQIYQLKVVVIGEEALNDIVIDAFTTIEGAIQQDIFPEDEFHLILTDGDFKAMKTIK